jgi:hypothetical protein
MIATLSKEDMENMLGGSKQVTNSSDDDLAELEAEMVDFD